MLDGFDLGVGVLQLFARNEEERQISIQAIGPFWDGNEVWPLTAGGLFYLPLSAKAKYYSHSFLASSVSIIGVIGMTATGLFPRMVPSSVNLMNSLSIYNASSTKRTLATMLIIALLGMPVVIVYTVYIYRVFRGKVDGIIKSY